MLRLYVRMSFLRSERTQSLAKMATWNSFSYICIRALHSFCSFPHWRVASAVIPLLPKATFTPSIQPNLGLPRTSPPLTTAIITILAIRCSFILSTCPNHLNTPLANSLSIPALQCASSFLTSRYICAIDHIVSKYTVLLINQFVQRQIFLIDEDITIIIIIKNGRQCKAERGWYTPYQSENPSPTIPTNRQKEEKGKSSRRL